MTIETTVTVGNYVNIIGELDTYLPRGKELHRKAVQISEDIGPIAVDTLKGIIEAVPGDYVEYDGRSLAVWSPGAFEEEFNLVVDDEVYEN